MTDGTNADTIDLIRWTFTTRPEAADAVAEHLHDLGFDVLVSESCQFVVLWDEPEGNVDEVIEAVWGLNGEPFEVTQEEFHRQALLHLQHDEGLGGELTAA